MADSSLKIEYTPGPTISRFIQSKSFYNVCMSGRGGGKTTGQIFRAIYQAQLQPKEYHPLRWAVIRDTKKSLGLTVLRTILRWCPAPFSRVRGKLEEPDSVTIVVKDKPLVTFDFFGMSSETDLNRLQSYEASGGVHIEEPAPVSDGDEFVASGVAENVLAIAVTSLRNAPHPTVSVTMNPPNASHWTSSLFHLPGYEAIDTEVEMPPEQVAERDKIRAKTSVFLIPQEENAANILTPGYTESNREMLLATGRGDLVARLVDGRVGNARTGSAVTPEFNTSHLSPGLSVIPNMPFLISFDYGLNPTCIVSQISPTGYLLIHKAWSQPNMGMKQLLQQYVQPWLAQQPVTQWSYCGGPEAVEREQSDSEETALRMIQRTLGGAPYRSGPVGWPARRDALRDALTRSPGGLPWVRVNPQGAALLVRCLDGGWHYPTDGQGHIRNESPDKRSRWDHLGDACSHLFAILLKKTDIDPSRQRQGNALSRQSMARVRSGFVPGSTNSRTGV